MSPQLAELLQKEKLISPGQFAEGLEAQAHGKNFVRYLIEKKYISETKLLYFLSQKFGLPSINLAKFEVPSEVIRLVPQDIARKNQFIPIQANKGTIVIAVADPTHLTFIEELRFRLKMNVEAVLTSYSALDAAVARYYGAHTNVENAIESFQKVAETEKPDEGTILMSIAQVHEVDGNLSGSEAPVITAVNGILADAIRRGASDIHIEPYEKRMRVRMRVDGTMVETIQIPMEMKRAMTARFKIMARMDIAEQRVPQDGRIKLRAGGGEIDFRVNSMPTLFGEKMVLRLLGKGNLQLDLQKLGFDSHQLEIFKKGVYASNGMVLVTGPTGSGKTTTLYSALQELNKTTDNLSTVEDPVEYNLEGVNQVQINKDVGLTFASVLRALLRQDPDTVLVGEIRDYETAEVAIQAALTGHLVLSTLHTNDAPSTITRLVNMGVEPFLVVASVNTIIAQRLLRTVCTKCKVEQPIPERKLLEIGFSPEVARTLKTYHGTGCPTCSGTGYKGRVAIYEIMDFTNSLKEMVLRGDSMIELKKQAMKEGMKTLRMSALSRVVEGRTTLEEALSMTMEG